MAESLVGQWGLYPWFEEHGTELIHPDDLAAFRKLLPYGKVFRCIGEESGYLVLQFGSDSYRVKPQLFKPVPPPVKVFGDRVRVSGVPGEAVVTQVTWHWEKGEHIYHLEVDGKKLKKRYWAADLESAAP